MNLTRLTSALTWRTAKGRELARLEEGAEQAEVIASKCSEEDLRALAQACIEAADQIKSYREAKRQAA